MNLAPSPAPRRAAAPQPLLCPCPAAPGQPQGASPRLRALHGSALISSASIISAPASSPGSPCPKALSALLCLSCCLSGPPPACPRLPAGACSSLLLATWACSILVPGVPLFPQRELNPCLPSCWGMAGVLSHPGARRGSAQKRRSREASAQLSLASSSRIFA